MPITVNIYYSGENGDARKFAEEMMSSGTVCAIRKEPGNLRYEYFYPADDEEAVHRHQQPEKSLPADEEKRQEECFVECTKHPVVRKAKPGGINSVCNIFDRHEKSEPVPDGEQARIDPV